MGGLLMVIFVFGVLNAAGDIVTLLLALTFGHNFIFRIFANEKLFFAAGPLTLLCNILFLVFILKRKFVSGGGNTCIALYIGDLFFYFRRSSRVRVYFG
jgi:hypothetical protein